MAAPRDENPPDGAVPERRFRLEGRAALNTDLVVPGVLLERYEVGEVIAVGESTVLLAGRDRLTHGAVAIKVLRNDRLPDTSSAAWTPETLVQSLRFARHLLQTERRLLVRLRNEGCNAVPVPIDYGHGPNPALAERSNQGVLDPVFAATEPFLVLEYLDGESLESVIGRDFPSGMDEGLALRLIEPIVSVIARLQVPWRLQSGKTWHCVYQDLKPANLMVDSLGRLVLVDFGGCQVVVDGVPVLEGSSTEGYAPPESASGGPARVLLACADVYTIGTTLLHMITGRDPCDRRRQSGTSPHQAALDTVSVRCSPGFRQFLSDCLAERPSRRPADARKALEVIRRLLAG